MSVGRPTRYPWVCLALTVGCGSSPQLQAEDGSVDETGDWDSSGDSVSGSESSGEEGEDDETGEDGEEESGETGEPDVGGGPDGPPTILFPRTRIAKEELAVLVNDADEQSVAVAEYYVMARGIPEQNVVHLDFPPGGIAMNVSDFETLDAEVDAALVDEIQAQAITWTKPYRVGRMSVTSAFALGYDDKWCNTSGDQCSVTAPHDYFDSDSFAPWTDHGIRPTMMLAGHTAEQVFELIDRGIASDDTQPVGDGYFVRTTDTARSVRWPTFLQTEWYWNHDGGLTLEYIDNSNGQGSNVVKDTSNVLFYFTGLANVPEIQSNEYLPGAIADHLTSAGGQVPESYQMSVVAWLEAGATGSFGTVLEPCAIPDKFPDTMVLLPNYFRGQTLVEAYWKSVHWPGEGLFVGEPLAAPWDGHTVHYDEDTRELSVTTTLLQAYVTYDVESGPSEDGPWTPVATGKIPKEQTLTIEIGVATEPFYRIVAKD